MILFREHSVWRLEILNGPWLSLCLIEQRKPSRKILTAGIGFFSLTVFQSRSKRSILKCKAPSIKHCMMLLFDFYFMLVGLKAVAQLQKNIVLGFVSDNFLQPLAIKQLESVCLNVSAVEDQAPFWHTDSSSVTNQVVFVLFLSPSPNGCTVLETSFKFHCFSKRILMGEREFAKQWVDPSVDFFLVFSPSIRLHSRNKVFTLPGKVLCFQNAVWCIL